MPRTRGVLLDIDGTLVDSNDAHARAWVLALEESGRRIPFETIRPLIGMGGDKLLPKVSGVDPESKEGKRISDRRGEIFQEQFLPNLRPTPGAERLLKLMADRGLKLVVATSAKKDELTPLLRVCGADKYIDDKTCSDDAEKSKPDPDILHVALEQLGLPPAEVVMLGDTPYDLEAAKKAGVPAVALRCGGWADADLKLAAAVYDHPDDLADKFDQSPLAD